MDFPVVDYHTDRDLLKELPSPTPNPIRSMNKSHLVRDEQLLLCPVRVMTYFRLNRVFGVPVERGVRGGTCGAFGAFEL
jgi:hypothetical protein